jgi:MoxR-like ATPase
MKTRIDLLTSGLGEIIVGKEQVIRLAVACLLARGHLLIEDVPGVGKTTLALALAKALGLHFRRIQFTSDLLPADILGNSIFDREQNKFIFHAGPLFSQVVLVDEVNRATPKTQSALLEAMEEHHVTVDGVTHALPEPFFVLATQNPQRQIGTFPLPESQLDRFLMRLELGVPGRAAERTMLLGGDRREMVRTMATLLDAGALREIQAQVRQVHTSPALLDYVQDLLEASRRRHRPGLSPRAGLALLRCCQAWALMQGREMALPEDVQAIGVPVMGHRLGQDLESTGENGRSLAQAILKETPVP